MPIAFVYAGTIGFLLVILSSFVPAVAILVSGKKLGYWRFAWLVLVFAPWVLALSGLAIMPAPPLLVPIELSLATYCLFRFAHSSFEHGERPALLWLLAGTFGLIAAGWHDIQSVVHENSRWAYRVSSWQVDGGREIHVVTPLSMSYPREIERGSGERAFGVSGDSIESEQIGADVLWPDMMVRNRESDKAFVDMESNSDGVVRSRIIHMSLVSAAPKNRQGVFYNSLEQAYETARDTAKRGCGASIQAMPGQPRTKAKCHDGDTPVAKPPMFGLKRVGTDFGSEKVEYEGAWSDDIYYDETENGKLNTLVVCMAEETKTYEDGSQWMMNPQCEQQFIFQSMNAKVSLRYRRAYLKDWKAIQENMGKLLQASIDAGEREKNACAGTCR